MKKETKCAIIGRKPRKENEYKTLFVMLFEENNGHLKDLMPKEKFDFENTEKGIIRGLDIDYFTEGNDLVINDLEYIEIEKKGTNVFITGKHHKNA